MNPWKLSTVILACVLAGFLLAQVPGLGLVAAQNGEIAKVQLDTSNCVYGVGPRSQVPEGALVVQAQPSSGINYYTYDVCR